MDIIRSFIALALPHNVISEIREIQAVLKRYRLNIRWVQPEKIHLTLKFLGDIRTVDIEIVAGAMGEAVKEASPFSLSARGFGVFPGVKRPRVLWAGLTGDVNRLMTLQQKLERALAECGYPIEKRSFKGHLTLGRTKGRIDPAKMADLLENAGRFKSESFTVDRLTLLKSDLKPKGAIYTKLAQAMFPL